MLRLATQLHKWIGLIVGIQVLFWTAGGLVMTAIPIETVRSEHHVAEVRREPVSGAGLLSLDEAAAAAKVTPVEATLKSTPRGAVWAFKDAEGKAVAVAALDGRPRPPATEGEAQRLAAAAYTGDGKPVAVRHFAEAPQETGKEGPLWRVDFDDAEKTSFYVDPATGEVVSKRSAVWRFYDFFWRLHILDLKNGEDFNHPLIVALSALAVVTTLTGFVLLWVRVGRDLKRAMRRGEP
jgi:uncharacterized iron-regulated membrane protein